MLRQFVTHAASRVVQHDADEERAVLDVLTDELVNNDPDPARRRKRRDNANLLITLSEMEIRPIESSRAEKILENFWRYVGGPIRSILGMNPIVHTISLGEYTGCLSQEAEEMAAKIRAVLPDSVFAVQYPNGAKMRRLLVSLGHGDNFCLCRWSQ